MTAVCFDLSSFALNLAFAMLENDKCKHEGKLSMRKTKLSFFSHPYVCIYAYLSSFAFAIAFALASAFPVCTSVCVYICISVCVCTCVHIWTCVCV